MGRKIVFNCVVYQENNQFVSICQQLDISSFGDTIEEAKANLEEAIKLYVDYAFDKDLVNEVTLNSNLILK